MMGGVPFATYQVSLKSVHQLLKSVNWFGRRFLKVFAIHYSPSGHLGHVTYTKFCSPFPLRLNINFGFNWSCDFRGEDVCTL